MTLPFYCIFVTAILVVLTKLPVAIAMKNQPEGYDNRNPRDQQAKLTGWGRRAWASHQNAFEDFPMFAAGVLIAHVGGADPKWATILSLTHVASRLFYSGFYLADLSTLRSTAWMVGHYTNLILMILPAIS